MPVVVAGNFETIPVGIAEVDREGLPVIHGTQLTDCLSGLAIHNSFPHVFQELKKSRTAHTESDTMMSCSGPSASSLSLKQRQLGISTIARNHERSAGSGPVFVVGKNSQPQRLFIPPGRGVSIRNEQLYMVDLLYLK